jgi:hypothetical protein
MFIKQKIKTIYVIITLIGLIVLLYLLKPRSEFEVCYDKCISSYPEKCYLSSFDKIYKEIYGKIEPERVFDCVNIKGYCVNICSRLK